MFAALQLPVVSGFLNLPLVLLGLKPAPNESWYKLAPAAACENNNSLSHCVFAYTKTFELVKLLP